MTRRRPHAPPSRIKRSQQVIDRAEKRAEGANPDPREQNLKERGDQGKSVQDTQSQGRSYNS